MQQTQSHTSRNQLNHTCNVLSASNLSEPPLGPMGESDTLPVSAEVLPPSPSSHSEERRDSRTPEEFTHPQTIPEHPHLYHAVSKEPSHHSGVDHHHHSIASEFILHPPTHIHHHTSQVENGEKHSETRKSDSRGKASPTALDDSSCRVEAARQQSNVI